MDDWNDVGINRRGLLRILGHPEDSGLIAGEIEFYDRYAYAVTWLQEDEEFIGLCAEFPSLSWLACTQDEALNSIRSLVADVVTDMIDLGEPLPAPASSS